jgi:hypothetical protein
MTFFNVEARAHLLGERKDSQSQHDRQHIVIDDPLPARLSGAMAIGTEMNLELTTMTRIS